MMTGPTPTRTRINHMTRKALMKQDWCVVGDCCFRAEHADAGRFGDARLGADDQLPFAAPPGAGPAF